jgi:hypothetical protein
LVAKLHLIFNLQNFHNRMLLTWRISKHYCFCLKGQDRTMEGIRQNTLRRRGSIDNLVSLRLQKIDYLLFIPRR